MARTTLSMPVKKSIYQLKITLLEIEPPIWRRIQVPVYYTLKDLHLAIQYSMGWKNCSRYHFLFYQENTTTFIDDGAFRAEYNSRCINSFTIRMNIFLSEIDDKLNYNYNLNDRWMHKIVLEKILVAVPKVRYPICVDGRRACPPEDVGGTFGYEQLLKILADPNHEEYNERVEFTKLQNASLDPEKFDKDSVVFEERTYVKPIFELKVTLLDVLPPIWRFILVPGDFTLHELHLAVQNAMGWTNAHLHQFLTLNYKENDFDIDHINSPNFESRIILDEGIMISEYLMKNETKLNYNYDFDEKWMHRIVLFNVWEAVPEFQYPICTFGSRACPPEGVGGPSGYEKHLKMLLKPNGRKSRNSIEWTKLRNVSVDPDFFDKKSVVFQKAERGKRIYQLKLTLLHIRPHIWRRIDVPYDFTVDKLHVAILNTMGWTDEHSYGFQIFDESYTGDAISILGDMQIISKNGVKISEFLIFVEDQLLYSYDVFNNWEIKVVLAKVLVSIPNVSYPRCVDGRRASPPENIGGPSGYKEHLRILANPNHKEYQDRVDWTLSQNASLDPEKFDKNDIVFTCRLEF